MPENYLFFAYHCLTSNALLRQQDTWMSKHLSILIQAHFMWMPAKQELGCQLHPIKTTFSPKDGWQVPIVKSFLLELNFKARLLLLKDWNSKRVFTQKCCNSKYNTVGYGFFTCLFFFSLIWVLSKTPGQQIECKGNQFCITALVLVHSLCSDLLRKTEKAWLKCINSAEQ